MVSDPVANSFTMYHHYIRTTSIMTVVDRPTVTVRVYATIGSDVEVPEGFVEIGTMDFPITFGTTKPVTREVNPVVAPVQVDSVEIEATANEVFYAMQKRLREPMSKTRTIRTLAEAMDARRGGLK